MTRNEFMRAFASALSTLPLAGGKTLPEPELAAALQYYEEYLDDAGVGPDEPVPAELNDPAALAREIIASAAEDAPPPKAAPAAECPAFRSVQIKVINAGVSFQEGNAYHVEIDYPGDLPTPTVEVRGTTLFIEEKPVRRRFRLFANNMQSCRVRVTVPKGRETSFESFRIGTANGGIAIPALAIEDVRCETVNGAINLTGVTADRLHAETVNGAIRLADCYAHAACRCETVNGSVTLSGEVRGETRADTVNGSIRISTSRPVTAYNLRLTAVTGSIYVGDEKHRRKVQIDNRAENSIHAGTVNGSIRLAFGE